MDDKTNKLDTRFFDRENPTKQTYVNALKLVKENTTIVSEMLQMLSQELELRKDLKEISGKNLSDFMEFLRLFDGAMRNISGQIALSALLNMEQLISNMED